MTLTLSLSLSLCQDENGLTPLMFAAKAGRTESAKILLKKGGQLAAKDLKGLTALHHAARNYQPKFIKMIIKQGIPVDIKDKKQLTALHHAISGMDQRKNVSQLNQLVMSLHLPV